MMRYLDKIRLWHAYVLSALLYFFISYGLQREQFTVLISSVSFLFIAYLFIYKRTQTQSDFSLGLLFSFLVRYGLLFSLPFLSDDIYRFYWDGLVFNSGISPFAFTPSELFNEGSQIVAGANEILYRKLNSPDYYSVYPAFLQYLFSFSAKIAGPENLLVFSMVLKAIILLFEVGTVYLLLKLTELYNVSRKKVLLYAFNPLIILELNANIHFEVIMIFFLLLTIYHWTLQRYLAGTTALSLAIASKLIPLIFVPFLIRRVGWTRTIFYGLFIVGLNVIYHAPFFSIDIIQNMYSSVALYYNKFEFNASIYYLMRWLGFKVVGWNMISSIGKVLQISTFIGIFLLALKRNSRHTENLMLAFYWALVLFLILSTTVHPWYIGSLIALGIFYFRSPLVWSFLIFLTYAAYLRTPYSENLWFTFMEYIIVLPLLLNEFIAERLDSPSPK